LFPVFGAAFARNREPQAVKGQGRGTREQSHAQGLRPEHGEHPPLEPSRVEAIPCKRKGLRKGNRFTLFLVSVSKEPNAPKARRTSRQRRRDESFEEAGGVAPNAA